MFLYIRDHRPDLRNNLLQSLGCDAEVLRPIEHFVLLVDVDSVAVGLGGLRLVVGHWGVLWRFQRRNVGTTGRVPAADRAAATIGYSDPWIAHPVRRKMLPNEPVIRRMSATAWMRPRGN